MNGVEFVVIECLKQKKWENAMYYLNQLLDTDDNQMENEKLLAYLLWRSQCFFELNKHEACIKDCRKIMTLVPNEAPRNNFWFKARWRLAHSLIQLKAFEEAKLIVEQLIDLCTDFTKQECLKLLERIKISSQFVSGRIALNNNSSSFANNDVNTTFNSEILNGMGNHNSEIEVKAKNSSEIEKATKDLSNSNACIFCNIFFDTAEEFRSHCSTQNHQQIIMSDEGRDWKKRPPPRGLTADTYNLCPAYGSGAVGVCKNGAQCVDAHGIEELNEWKERFEYRMMKLQRANEALIYGKSYTELLLNRLAETSNPELIIRETIEGVDLEVNGDLTAIIDSKICNKKWLFTLNTTKPLKVIALLYDSHRNHFFIQHVVISKNNKNLIDEEPINTQEWTSRLDFDNEEEDLTHQVEVTFATKLYGTFRQSVLFDFGTEPFLVQHLCVDVVPVKDAEKMKEMRQELVLSSTERWEKSTANIIPFISTVVDTVCSARENELLSKYYVPTGRKFTITQSVINDDSVTINNYRSRMQELLYVEEMACYDQVAKYSVQVSLQIVSSYILSPSMFGASTAKFSAGGELFAMISLNEDVSEDSPGGRLVLNNCVTVLLAEKRKIRKVNNSSKKPKVYEALIEDKGKNVVYLRLSAQMVSEMKLKPDTSVTLEMQFQLNRLPFCEWHYAVDCISNYRIIFPDIVHVPEIQKITEKKWMEEDEKLNEKQKEAIVAITVPQNVVLPPVLIIGPFGTGKTYTLAQAIKHILLEEDTKILICTHSNSAADLYIKEYLHYYVQAGLKEATPLRIYYHKRWVSTVNSVVLEYCLTEVRNGARIFRIPTLEDVLKHRIIVVTLNIASHLSAIGLPKGHFSHILLDEAAQAIECEAIMPLALANEKTRIVLAGDHMQLSPEIFSSFAKQRNFHVSLLQRLYENYPPDFPCKIILCENYRAHKAIVKFTSNLFYDNKLVSVGRQPKHKKFYPLTFFTALGEDIQESNSTGFYNCAEVYELVERVAEMKKDWPERWGKFNEYSIGIMTPYPDQVYRIRIELKKRKILGISVERVLNVQGKQFRVVFLSTVRTARTCVSNEEFDCENTSLMDYGFLSNKKLLNTAVTRAQSLVAVVGDPVSLCSIGRCRKIWENFIEICCKNNSFYGLTWQDLKSLLLAVELKKKYKLNPLAPEFVPRFQTEPYLQFADNNYNQSTGGGLPLNNVNYQTNNAANTRFYTYDNIRYQLPPKTTVLPNPIVPQTTAVPPAMHTHIKWNQSTTPPVPPVVSSHHNCVNTATTINLKKTVQSIPPPPSSSRTPPGFSPLHIRANPLLYQQFSNQSLPNMYPSSSQFAPSPANAAAAAAAAAAFVPQQPIRNVVSPDTSIPLQVTLIPLSQYVRTHPPPSFTNLSQISKPYNTSLANYGNPIYSPPVNLQNGYKSIVAGNATYIPNMQNDLSASHACVLPQNNVNMAAGVSNIATTSQSEHDLKNILPPNTSLAEVLRNSELQKQWLSYLMDSKQIHSAQQFLNVISANAPKENNTLQVTKITQSKEVLTLQESALSASPGSTLVCFISNSSSTTNIINADRNLPGRDYTAVSAAAAAAAGGGGSSETSIPPDVHLPSSLLSDILPSTSNNKRTGPLYDRQSTKAIAPIGTRTSDNYFAQMVMPNGGPTAATLNDHHNNIVEHHLSLPNGEHDFVGASSGPAAVPLSSSVATAPSQLCSYPETATANSLVNNCPIELQTQHLNLDGSPSPWNMMSRAFGSTDRLGMTDANSMTYAAVLRQAQQKFSSERNRPNDNSYFNF